MLPGLIETSIAQPPSYTARPDWTSPHESAWSLISKFQALNRLSQARLAEAVGLRIGGLNQNGCDLRTSHGFDGIVLSNALRLPQDRIAHSFCATNRDDALLDSVADVLRFCVHCIQGAFHSPFTQFFAFSRCPIHRTRLRTTCPKCKIEMLYRLNPRLAERPYRCPHCDVALCPGVDHPRGLAPSLNNAQIAQLDCWRNYFDRMAKTLCRGPRRKVETPATRATESASISRTQRLGFVGELQRHYRQPPPHLSVEAAFTRNMLTALPQWRARLPMIACYGYVQHWRRLDSLYVWLDLFYRKRCEQILITLDSTVRDCEVLRQIPHLDNWIDLSKTALPTAAAALLAWRMSWEGRLKPCTLHDTEQRYPAFGIFEWLAFAPCRPHNCTRAGWDAALIRRFALDLDRVWQAWFEIITWMHGQGGYFLHPRLVPIRELWIEAETR